MTSIFGATETPTVDELIEGRKRLQVEAASYQLAPRLVSASFYDAGGLGYKTTADGIVIGAFFQELTTETAGREIRVSIPVDAPREEVAAVLRHLLKAIEAGEVALPERLG